MGNKASTILKEEPVLAASVNTTTNNSPKNTNVTSVNKRTNNSPKNTNVASVNTILPERASKCSTQASNSESIAWLTSNIASASCVKTFFAVDWIFLLNFNVSKDFRVQR